MEKQQPVAWTISPDYIDPYVTHMDEKKSFHMDKKKLLKNSFTYFFCQYIVMSEKSTILSILYNNTV